MAMPTPKLGRAMLPVRVAIPSGKLWIASARAVNNPRRVKLCCARLNRASANANSRASDSDVGDRRNKTFVLPPKSLRHFWQHQPPPSLVSWWHGDVSEASRSCSGSLGPPSSQVVAAAVCCCCCCCWRIVVVVVAVLISVDCGIEGRESKGPGGLASRSILSREAEMSGWLMDSPAESWRLGGGSPCSDPQ